MLGKQFVRATGLAVVGLIVTAGLVRAQVTGADVGLNPTYEQTGDTLADVTSTGGFFSARVDFMNPGDYTGGALSLPGGQTRPLANQGDPLKIGYTDAPLGPDYTAGAYGFDISGSIQPEAMFSIGYAGDAYSNTPYLTNFTALEQMDANTPFTVDFDTYVPGGNANESVLFFSISNLSGTVFSTGGLPDTTTSVVIPAGTLVAGEQYTFDLLFSNRINGSTAVTGDGVPDSIDTTQFCDTHTDGAFSTAPGTVPESSTWAMLLIGFAGLGLAGYRSARKTSVAATAA
jgi:hypothetical protein